MANETSSAPSTAPITSSTTETTQTQTGATVPVAKELTQALADPSLSTTEKKEITKRIKELTLKVDGKTFKESIPFEVDEGSEAEEYMKKHLQLAKLGQKRAQYAKTLESEVSDFFQKLKEDPRAILSDPTIGIDLKKLANSIIQEEIENSKKSPEQLEKEKLQKELKQMKDEREQEKQKAEQQEIERLTQSAYTTYENNIIKTIDAAKDLPKSTYVVKKFADYMMAGLKMNADLSPEDVLPLVRADISNDIKQMFSSSPDEMLEAMIGKDRLNNVRRKNLEKAKKALPTAPLKTLRDVPGQKSDDKPEKKIPYRQFFKL